MSTTMKFYKPEEKPGLLHVRTVKIWTGGTTAEINLIRQGGRRGPFRAEAIRRMRRQGFVTKAEIKPSQLRNFVRVVKR